jgi:hypothetical protein
MLRLLPRAKVIAVFLKPETIGSQPAADWRVRIDPHRVESLLAQLLQPDRSSIVDFTQPDDLHTKGLVLRGGKFVDELTAVLNPEKNQVAYLGGSARAKRSYRSEIEAKMENERIIEQVVPWNPHLQGFSHVFDEGLVNGSVIQTNLTPNVSVSMSGEQIVYPIIDTMKDLGMRVTIAQVRAH